MADDRETRLPEDGRAESIRRKQMACSLARTRRAVPSVEDDVRPPAPEGGRTRLPGR